MMLERCYWNLGSCSCSGRINLENTRAASKQSLYYRKANSSQGCWEVGEEHPSLFSYRGFHPLNMGGGLLTLGSERCGFLPLALPNYLYQSLSNRSLRGRNVPISFMVSLLFSSHKLSHRWLGINVHLGIGTLPIVNKACGDVTPWSP